MQFQRLSGPSDDPVRITVAGRIRQADLPKGNQSYESALGPREHAQRVLLDLSPTDFIDSSGIGWLLGVHKKVEAAGGRLVLHSVPPLVNRVLKLMKLDTVLEIAPDEPQAAARLQEKPA